MPESAIIETAFAWFERPCPDVVVQRWKQGITLDVATIRATMELRGEHFANNPYAAVVIVPEGTRFAMSFLDRDQYEGTEAARNMFAMANVVEEDDVRAIVELYYAQHPPKYLFGVFRELTEGMLWIEERLAERRAFPDLRERL